MTQWTHGTVTLALHELRERIHGKRIALMMNTTALDNEGGLLIDRIADERWACVEFLLGMEHGVRGNLFAGDGKLAAYDVRTGLPIVNLYDYPKHQPPIDRLKELDAVVFCAQDVGVRHWTYTPWLMLLIDSAAEAGCEVIVLDRPNPIRGDIVEGASAEAPYAGTHLLSGFSYPLRHGMTVGELALMYQKTHQPNARVTVLKMHGWRRDMWYEETGLPWVPASPNMPTVDTALYFAATGLLQSSNVSYGIGTTTPFQYVGRPDFDGERLARALNARGLAGIYFLQKYYQSKVCNEYRLCDGVLMLINDRNAWHPVEAQLHVIDTLRELFPDQFNPEYNDMARTRMGTDAICDAVLRGESLLPVIDQWRQGAREFETARAPYLLYT